MAKQSKTSKTTQPTVQPVTPGVLSIQWLTYAFWGWLAIMLVWLSSIAFRFIVAADRGFETEEVVYPVASVMVLLIIALISDLAYSRHETAKKSGISAGIMIIHTVIFAVGLIASIITALFAASGMLMSFSEIDSQKITLFTALALTLYCIALVLRTSTFKKFNIMRPASRLALAIIPLIILSIAIYGPVARTFQSKQDRLIDSSIPVISSALYEYVSKNNQLPATLDKIDLSHDIPAREALKQNLIDYKPNTHPADEDAQFYQLCATYKFKKSSPYGEKSSQPTIEPGTLEKSDYAPYPDTTNHSDGLVCYKLAAHLDPFFEKKL